MPTRISILCVCLALAGCMPYRFYPLPVSAAEASATFAPIATAASNFGYRFYQYSDQVIVEPDARTRIAFMFDASGNYAMGVMIKNRNPPGGIDRAIAEAKAKGDDLWNRAMALRPATAAAPLPAPAPPSPTFQLNISH